MDFDEGTSNKGRNKVRARTNLAGGQIATHGLSMLAGPQAGKNKEGWRVEAR